MSELTSKQILAVNNVKLSMHIKVSEESDKFELISAKEMEYKHVCPGKKPKHKHSINIDHSPTF